MSATPHSPAPSSGPGVPQLLAQAQQGDQQQLGVLLQHYRNYLTILAATQFDARLRRRISPSDIVQEAFLGAYRDFPAFRGRSEHELLAWLRQILIHCLHHAYEAHIRAERRDVRRELSLEGVDHPLHRSAARLQEALAAAGSSPSGQVERHERAVEVANILARLRPDYREVIVLRNLQGLSFDEVARQMGRNTGAARMLWLRAVEKFRQLYSLPQ